MFNITNRASTLRETVLLVLIGSLLQALVGSGLLSA